MKKIEYMAPKMEIVELKSNVVLLAGSGEETPGCMTKCNDED